jgi:hypothetical protein
VSLQVAFVEERGDRLGERVRTVEQLDEMLAAYTPVNNCLFMRHNPNSDR